jgi:hypothetical protein
MSVNAINHLHTFVIKALNLVGRDFGMPAHSLADFTNEGFSGYVYPERTPRDRSLCLMTENDKPSGMLDVRHWGIWETDPQAEWDTDEDDDWEVLSQDSAKKIQQLVDDVSIAMVNTIDPNLTLTWQTGEKNHIEFTVTFHKK